MTDLLPPTWLEEDLPVLIAAVELVDDEGSVTHDQIARAADVSEDMAKRALRRLNGEYLDVKITKAAGGFIFHAVAVDVLPAGRRASGQWPNPEDMAREIAEELEAAEVARRDEDGLVREVGGFAKDLVTQITVGVINRQMGLG